MAIAYLSNQSGSAVSTGDTIPMLTIVRRKNSCIDTAMNLKPGYYSVIVEATLTSTDGGLGTITLYQDGAPVASSSQTIAAAGTVTIVLPAVVKSKCCGSTLTIGYVGAAITSATASVVIENA